MRAVLGKPVPFARPGQTSDGRRYTPERYRTWKEAAGWQMKGEHLGDGPVSVRVEVHKDRIEYEFGKAYPIRPRGIRGDLDNYVKALLDAAQDCGVIADDRQVVSIEATFHDGREVV